MVYSPAGNAHFVDTIDAIFSEARISFRGPLDIGLIARAPGALRDGDADAIAARRSYSGLMCAHFCPRNQPEARAVSV